MKLAENQFEYNNLYNLRNMCLQPRHCVPKIALDHNNCDDSKC